MLKAKFSSSYAVNQLIDNIKVKQFGLKSAWTSYVYIPGVRIWFISAQKGVCYITALCQKDFLSV